MRAEIDEEVEPVLDDVGLRRRRQIGRGGVMEFGREKIRVDGEGFVGEGSESGRVRGETARGEAR